MAPHSSTLAWKIPLTEEPGRLQSVASWRVGHNWVTSLSFPFHFHALGKEMANHSSVLAWRIPGMAEPGGLLSMGSHRVGHGWSDLAAAEFLRSSSVSWSVGRPSCIRLHIPGYVRSILCSDVTAETSFADFVPHWAVPPGMSQVSVSLLSSIFSGFLLELAPLVHSAKWKHS